MGLVPLYSFLLRHWALKNWSFWTVVLEKTLESPLDCKEIKPVNLKGNQSWIFIRKTDAEATIFWPPDAKKWLIGKDHDAREDWRQEEKWMTEDKMVGWHHQFDGRVWASSGSRWWTGKPGVLQSRGLQKDTAEWLNGTELLRLLKFSIIQWFSWNITILKNGH